MIVLVCGSRDCKDETIIEEAIIKGIEELQIKPKTFIHGDAPGVDRIAGEVCEKMGYNVVKYPAKWNDITGKDPQYIKTNKWNKKYYTMAGFERNSLMIEKANAVIAINLGTNGTEDTIKKARKAKLKLYIYEPDMDSAINVNFWDE